MNEDNAGKQQLVQAKKCVTATGRLKKIGTVATRVTSTAIIL